MSGPEAEAREIIDQKLTAAGWIVQSRDDMNLMAGPGIAAREFPLKPGHGQADYLLYVDARVIGVVEAKPVGRTLSGVEAQSARSKPWPRQSGVRPWRPAPRISGGPIKPWSRAR